MSTDIGLVFGFIIFFLDLLLFCIFLSRVRISFNKHILDDDWQTANDYWLKLSRVSGAIFCLFHLGIMIIVLTEILNINTSKPILHYNGVAHIYWIFQSLWILITNLAIVLITQRMFRVYKTTSTPFTPLKNWIVNNEKLIEYFIWTLYVFITLTIAIQYIIIISSKPHQYFDIELSIINAIRNFCTAIILFMQLIIACFFSYIAHKSQKQTNWNQQSKSIICKETAKLAFIVLFLALIVGVIFYTAIWYLINLNYKTSLNMPFNSTNKRIFWSVLEFLGFWLILYLTRLRKPVSQNDMMDESHSRTSSKQFLKRTFTPKKQKQKQLKQFKMEQLEKRKQQFQEREKKRKLSNNKNNSFNTLFIKQVAKYQKEKTIKLKLINEIQQQKRQKSPKKSPRIEENHKIKIDITSPKENNSHNNSNTITPSSAAKHFRQMKSDGMLHITMQTYQNNNENNNKELNVLMEDKLERELTDTNNSFTDEILPLKHKHKHKLNIDLKLPQMDDIEVDMDDTTPVPTHVNTMITAATPDISCTPTHKFTLTPKHNYRNHHVSVVITPANTNVKKVNINNNITATFYSPESSIETIENYNTADDMTTDCELDSEHENDKKNNNENSNDKKKKDNGIGLKTIIAKIGSVFTPHPSSITSEKSNNSNSNNNTTTSNNSESNIEMNKFPNVRVVTHMDTNDSTSYGNKGFPIQFQTAPINLAPISDVTQETNDIIPEKKTNNSENNMDDIIDMYMDAFKKDAESDSMECKENEKDMETAMPIPLTIPQRSGMSKQQSGEFTSLIGDGIFHNVHLKPTLLKRSHSDPDIRVRNKIWDQLLMAFKKSIDENSQIQLPANNTFLGNYVSDITQEISIKDCSRRNSINIQIENENEMNDNDMDISRISHITQLSVNESDKEFNIFGWFDHINKQNDSANNSNNNSGIDMEIVDELKQTKSESVRNNEQQNDRRKTQKVHSSKVWRNLVKKKGVHHMNRDSLEIPTNNLPMDGIYQTNKPQQLSVKLSNNINENNNSNEKELEVTKLKEQKSKDRHKHRRKLKSRIRRKKQTKQWINNVHQVF